VADHNSKTSASEFPALQQIHELLSTHPGYKAVPVVAPPDSPGKTSRLGLLIRRWRFRRFGAEFEGVLSLLNFRLHRENSRTLVLELQWHVTALPAGRSVFIHFLDAKEEIRFYGDYALDRVSTDAFGFFYSRRQVDVPPDVPPGAYRIRLGVWCPTENRLVALTRFSGCTREREGWCHSSVLLDSVNVTEEHTA